MPGVGTGPGSAPSVCTVCRPQISPSHNEITRTPAWAAALLSVTHSVHFPMDVHMHRLVFVAIKQPTRLWQL